MVTPFRAHQTLHQLRRVFASQVDQCRCQHRFRRTCPNPYRLPASLRQHRTARLFDETNALRCKRTTITVIPDHCRCATLDDPTSLCRDTNAMPTNSTPALIHPNLLRPLQHRRLSSHQRRAAVYGSVSQHPLRHPVGQSNRSPRAVVPACWLAPISLKVIIQVIRTMTSHCANEKHPHEAAIHWQFGDPDISPSDWTMQPVRRRHVHHELSNDHITTKIATRTAKDPPNGRRRGPHIRPQVLRFQSDRK